MDYNEDRQVTFDQVLNKEKHKGLASNVVESNDVQHALIYLDTVGKVYKAFGRVNKLICHINVYLEPMELIGEGEYNLNALKVIEVTESYLGLDEHIKGCQTEESLHDCNTRCYIEKLIEQCGCLPFKIKMSDKVPIHILVITFTSIIVHFSLESTLCFSRSACMC